MTIVDLRSNLHQLIDSIHNPGLLEALHEILMERRSAREGHLWEGLSAEQKKEVFEAFEESEDLTKMISHEEMLKRFG